MISRGQLRDAGLSADAINRLLRSGGLDRHLRGVFVVRGAPVTHEARVWISVLATQGIVGFATAAHFWGVLDEAPPYLDVIVSHQRRVTVPFGTRVSRVFVPTSAIRRSRGLPITERRWTVLDVLGRLDDAAARRLADRALQRSWITLDDITRRLADYPGRAGNRILRLIAATAGDGAAAESERRLHRILRHAGLAGWVANMQIRIGGHIVAIVDVAFPRARLAIEVDGWAYHSDVERFQRDRHRQNTLQALGWTVLRFTWADLVERPEYVAGAIRGQLTQAS